MRSELAAKGIDSAVNTSASAELTKSYPALHTPATSTHVSSKASSSSREGDTAASATSAAGRTAVFHGTSSHDYGRHSTLHATVPLSSSASATVHNVGYCGTGRTAAVGTSGPRSLHSMSAVSKTYRDGPVISSGHSYNSSTANGHATRVSRRENYDRLHASRTHNSYDTASGASRTGVYDTNSRYH